MVRTVVPPQPNAAATIGMVNLAAIGASAMIPTGNIRNPGATDCLIVRQA